MEKESVVPEFFGAIDREGKKADGRITSEYPAWFNKRRIERQREEVEDDKRRLEWYPQMRDTATMIMEKNRIKIKEEHLTQLEYMPDISKIKNELGHLREKCAKLIREEMYDCRSDMFKGLANVHGVYSKLNDYRWGDGSGINIRGVEGAIIQKMNIKHMGGKFKGKDIVKIFRMTSVLLNEDPSDEKLRKDYAYGTYKEDVPYERMVKEAGI